MLHHIKRRWHVPMAVILAVAVTACSFMQPEKALLRSDPSIAGYTGSMLYSIGASPNGDGEKNEIAYRGINGASPMPLLTTTFGKGANSNTQVAQITAENGAAINALSMNRWGSQIGLTDYLDTKVTTYEQRDALGNRICGAKVRLNFKPNIIQAITNDRYRRAWDALFYYTIPCGVTTQPASNGTSANASSPAAPTIRKPDVQLDFSKAKFLALVINQQFTPRVTGKPIVFNRGHSVTIVGGRASRLQGGWWEYPASMITSSDMIIDMVKDLDSKEWTDFGNRDNGGLVYSAGDADVYASWQRFFLNRQDSYLVNFRAKPSDPWRRILVNPLYNTEWNDFSQNYKALTNKDMPDIDNMIDANTGLPKEVNNPGHEDSKKLKEIETAGCQNCPNPTLEQIQLIDATEGSPTNGQPLYAMTIRGWLGSQSSLVMFGKVPGSPDSYMKDADARREQTGIKDGRCPVQRNENGERLEDKYQYSQEDCALWLREGGLWDLITRDASKFGLDVVGQFRVRDNSAWASHCSGSGESTYCSLEITRKQLDAAYMFTDTGDQLQKAWTIMQLLGEVGMRSLGLSYASGVYDGSGLDFAMAQPQVYNSYYTDMADPANPYNPELLFALDARALQLPETLGKAADYLY